MSSTRKGFSVTLFAIFFIAYLLYVFFGVIPFKEKLFFIEIPLLRDILFGLLLLLPVLPIIIYFLIKKIRKNKTDDNYKITTLIDKAIETLNDGNNRFASTNKLQFKDVCVHEFSKVILSDRNLWSDYGMPSGNKELESDYFEEITLLVKLLEESNLTYFPNSQKDKLGKLMEYDKVLKRRAIAMNIWNTYAIPWRFKNNTVHIIFSPTDIMEKPIIDSYDVSSFIKIIAIILEQRASNEIEKSKHLFYKNLAISALILFCFALTLLLIKC